MLRGIFDGGGVRKQNGHWQSSNMVIGPIDDTVWEIRGSDEATDYYMAQVEGSIDYDKLTYISGNVRQSLLSAVMSADLVAGRKYKLSLSLSMSHSGPYYNQDIEPWFPYGDGIYADDTREPQPIFDINNRLLRTVNVMTSPYTTLFTIDSYTASHTREDRSAVTATVLGYHGYDDGYSSDTEPWIDNFTCEVVFTCEQTGTYETDTGSPSAGYGMGLLDFVLSARGRVTQEVSVSYSIDYKLSRIS